MTVLYIILGLLLLCGALFFSSLTLTVDYNEKFTAKVGWLGLKLNLAKEKKEKPKKEKSPKKKADGKPKRKEESALKKRFRENSFSENVRFVIGLLREIFPQFKYLLRHTRVRQLKLDLKIVGADAAKTAIEYGGVCSVLYPFLAWADSFLDLSMKKVDVSADFAGEKSKALFHVKLKIRVIILLISAFKLIKLYLKLTEVNENERKKHKFNH
ncbi:MAG: DUF2953 domain-containing protein [Clostridia bacterium]|nr:DUF2953 domain-containing protein [Clostridia bacterium]